MVWKVTSVEADTRALTDLLADGWEPYGVAPVDAGYYFQNSTMASREWKAQTRVWIHLRKQS